MMCPFIKDGELVDIQNQDIPADGQFLVPTGVRTIGAGAFTEYSSLKHVRIPNSVTVIRGGAFRNCSHLQDCTLPAKGVVIRGAAFFGCSSLTAMIIPDGMTTIDEYTFDGCSSLSRVSIPDSVTVIAKMAFSNCSSLSLLSIPHTVTQIGICAFSGCNSLIAVRIPDNVTEIGVAAFEHCSSLKTVRIPDRVTTIAHSTFSNCSSLRQVQIPEGVTEIGHLAFYCCVNLRTVRIPDSVTAIGNYAFSDCSSLSAVNIPDNVTTIGDNAFARCTHLSAIIIDSDDSTNLARIGKMLPDDLQALIVHRAMYAEIVKAQEEAMHAMRAEPTLGSLPGLRSRLSADPQTIIASYEENSLYAQIQQKLLAHKIPRHETELATYKSDLRNIVYKETSSRKKCLCIARLVQYVALARRVIRETRPAPADEGDALPLRKNMQNIQRLKIVDSMIDQLKNNQAISLSDAQKELLQGGMVSKILEEHDMDLGLNSRDPAPANQATYQFSIR